MRSYEDPRWVKNQAISLDYTYAMADFVGGHGLQSHEGRPGYEAHRQEFTKAAPKLSKYYDKII